MEYLNKITKIIITITVVMKKNNVYCSNADQLNVCNDVHGNRLPMIIDKINASNGNK